MKIFTCFLLPLFFMGTVYAQNNSHNASTDEINFKPKIPIKSVGIFIYDGFNTLDAMGPYHVLSQIMGAEVFFVAKQKGLVQNQKGMEVNVEKSIVEVDSLDILIIPGGAKETYLITQDQSVLDWIKIVNEKSVYTGSVCTGSWILGAAGLLEGKNATTNWYRAEEMMKKYGANFKEERYVRDGKYWTSAGVTAGMDMSLAIVNDLFGQNYTEAVMLDLEYDPKPPFDAGSIKKAKPIIKKTMKKIYDGIFLPVMQN